MPFKSYYKYNLNFGSTTGIVSISYDTNPSPPNPAAIPVSFKITWSPSSGTVAFSSGFRGDGSFNSDLIAKGYATVTGGSTGTLSFLKTSAIPSTALLEVFLPLYNSKANFSVVCPTPTPGPSPTPTTTPPGWTPGPTATPGTTPETTATPEATATPGPSPTPTETLPDPPCVDCPEGSTNPDCCPPTPKEPDDTHFAWNGNKPFASKVIENYAIADENGTGLGDHWAINWYEVLWDGTLNAVLTKRKQPCLYPGGTSVTEIKLIRSPIAMIFNWYRVRVAFGDCNPCAGKIENWYAVGGSRFVINNFNNIMKFGGTHWDFIRFIASKRYSNLNAGITGPIGPFASISGDNLRLYSENPTKQDVLAAIAGDSGYNTRNAFETIKDFKYIADYIDGANLDLTQTLSTRRSLWIQGIGDQTDPCCGGPDTNWTDGTCGGPTEEGWYPETNCSCTYYESDPENTDVDGYPLGGPFETKDECLMGSRCGASYLCDNGSCSLVTYATGPNYYETMEECEANCQLPPKWYFDECSGGQASCVQGTPPFLGMNLYDSQSECEGDNASNCVSSCGSCQYSYDSSSNEWNFNFDNCGAGCSCPSESYVNSNDGNSGGCDGEPTCTTCSAPCTPYSGFMFSSESKDIDW